MISTTKRGEPRTSQWGSSAAPKQKDNPSSVELSQLIRSIESRLTSPKPVYDAAKRCLDIALAGTGVIVFAPVFLLAALAIKADSRGPVFFRQKRRGQHGRTIWIYKFRTMIQNAEAMKADLTDQNEASGPIFKIQNDPRVTRVGRFLRRTSLDELPQLLNVLSGQMSLIGPRAMCVKELDLTDSLQWIRLKVKPGVMCLREINGRSKLSFDEWMHYDLEYLRNRSLSQDLSILLRAVPAVLRSEGAY